MSNEEQDTDDHDGTEDNGKEPYPDDVEKTEGWPENSELPLETINDIVAESTASKTQIVDLLDVESVREEHGKITEEALRRHVSAVEQLNRMFDSHEDGKNNDE